MHGRPVVYASVLCVSLPNAGMPGEEGPRGGGRGSDQWNQAPA